MYEISPAQRVRQPTQAWSTQGQTLVEYSLLLVLCVMAVLTFMTVFADGVIRWLMLVNSSIPLP